MVVDDSVVEVIKWMAAAVVIPAAGWFWRKHEQEHTEINKTHKAIWAKTDKLEAGMLTASSGLNNRIMEHIDVQVKDTKAFVMAEDSKIIAEVTRQRDVSAKIFDILAENNRRSEDRHSETMGAIHNLAMTMHESLAKKADK